MLPHHQQPHACAHAYSSTALSCEATPGCHWCVPPFHWPPSPPSGRCGPSLRHVRTWGTPPLRQAKVRQESRNNLMRHTTWNSFYQYPLSFLPCHSYWRGIAVCSLSPANANPPGTVPSGMALPRWRRPCSQQQTALQSSFAPPVHSGTNSVLKLCSSSVHSWLAS